MGSDLALHGLEGWRTPVGGFALAFNKAQRLRIEGVLINFRARRSFALHPRCRQVVVGVLSVCGCASSRRCSAPLFLDASISATGLDAPLSTTVFGEASSIDVLWGLDAVWGAWESREDRKGVSRASSGTDVVGKLATIAQHVKHVAVTNEWPQAGLI